MLSYNLSQLIHVLTFTLYLFMLHFNMMIPSASTYFKRYNSSTVIVYMYSIFLSRSQWPHGLRHELSLLARTLGSWVPKPHEVWIFVCVYSVFV
jgi:hypothetical protein